MDTFGYVCVRARNIVYGFANLVLWACRFSNKRIAYSIAYSIRQKVKGGVSLKKNSIFFLFRVTQWRITAPELMTFNLWPFVQFTDRQSQNNDHASSNSFQTCSDFCSIIMIPSALHCPLFSFFFIFIFSHFTIRLPARAFIFQFAKGNGKICQVFLSLVPFSFLLLHCNFLLFVCSFYYIVLVLSFTSSLFLSFRIIYFCFFSLGIKFLQVSLCALSVGL